MSTIVDQGLGSAQFVSQGYIASAVVVPPLSAPLPGYSIYLYAPPAGRAFSLGSTVTLLSTSAKVGRAIVGLAVVGAP
jgi:hypothetical protein